MIYLPLQTFYPSCIELFPIVVLICCCAIHIGFGASVFDLVHWLAHRSRGSPYFLLRLLYKAHQVHHQFFNAQLQYNDKFKARNLMLHLPLELLCQTTGALCSWWLLRRWTLSTPVYVYLQRNIDLKIALTFQTVRCSFVAYHEGRDSNHIPYKQLPKDPCAVLVGSQYHSLHHLDPSGYFGSMTRLVDWILGTAVSLKGRRVAMTGSRGALGRAMTAQLEILNVKAIVPLRFGEEEDWTVGSYSKIEQALGQADILILAHGTKADDAAMQSNCRASIDLIELFNIMHHSSWHQLRPRLLPEVWYVGSEAEFHGAWSSDARSYVKSKRSFLPFARAFCNDEKIVYRHIVPAAFHSDMGGALVSADWVAKAILWWICRGARYVPVTYTGFAYLNFFRFYYWVRPHQRSR